MTLVLPEEAEDRKYVWEISPNPYTTEFDMYVTDDDKEALEAIKVLAEDTWDSIEDDEEKYITVRRNKRDVPSPVVANVADEDGAKASCCSA